MSSGGVADNEVRSYVRPQSRSEVERGSNVVVSIRPSTTISDATILYVDDSKPRLCDSGAQMTCVLQIVLSAPKAAVDHQDNCARGSRIPDVQELRWIFAVSDVGIGRRSWKRE